MKSIFSTLVALLSCTLAFGQYNPASFNEQKQTVTLKTGIHMSYVDSGNPKGEPVLLLHGCTDTSRSFEPLMEELSKLDRNLRMIAPDLRGHGGTSMPDASGCKEAPEKCFTQEQFAADIINLLDQLNVTKVHVVGHSMGSITAQTLALNYRDRISSMVLIGTFVNGKESPAIQEFLINDLIETKWKSIIEKQGLLWPADAYFRTPASLGDEVKTFLKNNWVTEQAAEPEFVDAIFPETISIPLGTWIGSIRSLGDIDNQAALKDLKIPALILWSSGDNFFSVAEQEQVKSAFQAAAKSKGTKVLYKAYENLPLESETPAKKLEHNFHWAVPNEVASDIHSFISIGQPIASKGRSVVKLE